MVAFFKFLIFVIKYTSRKYSFLRILQIFEASKTELSGTILDLGGNDFSHNISKYFNGTYTIQFADKFPKDEKTIKVDLEHDEDLSQKFDNVCLMNILEHIKNYKNVINFSNKTLNVNGRIIGSVPFLFKIHYSPNDYFRFTEQLLYEEFRDSGFEKIEIKPLSKGIFSSFYSIIFDYTKKIPLLNTLLITICLILDKIFFFINKNYIKNYPLGYYFIAIKKN
jgi:hypothetical protein